jgi:hypothetical protein
MLVAETTVNDVATVPPKLTAVAPVKSVPVIVTVAPSAALVGVKEVMVGAIAADGVGSSFLLHARSVVQIVRPIIKLRHEFIVLS